MIALLIGLIYLDQDYDQAGLSNLNATLFLMLTNMTFNNIFSVVNVSPQNSMLSDYLVSLYDFKRKHYNV